MKGVHFSQELNSCSVRRGTRKFKQGHKSRCVTLPWHNCWGMVTHKAHQNSCSLWSCHLLVWLILPIQPSLSRLQQLVVTWYKKHPLIFCYSFNLTLPFKHAFWVLVFFLIIFIQRFWNHGLTYTYLNNEGYQNTNSIAWIFWQSSHQCHDQWLKRTVFITDLQNFFPCAFLLTEFLQLLTTLWDTAWILGGPMQSWELDSIILVGPSQLGMFYGSMILGALP